MTKISKKKLNKPKTRSLRSKAVCVVSWLKCCIYKVLIRSAADPLGRPAQNTMIPCPCTNACHTRCPCILVPGHRDQTGGRMTILNRAVRSDFSPNNLQLGFGNESRWCAPVSSLPPHPSSSACQEHLRSLAQHSAALRFLGLPGSPACVCSGKR